MIASHTIARRPVPGQPLSRASRMALLANVSMPTQSATESGAAANYMPDWARNTVGCGIAFIVIIAGLNALLLWCLWKKRNLIALKIVYCFQRYEDVDNDGKKFDVYISYLNISGEETDDQQFVVHKLHPTLEHWMGFTVCVDYKCYHLGAYHADNIVEFIQQSRRTILVLSPEYLQAHWPRFEREVAQMEMIKQSHGIIPLVVKDISHVAIPDSDRLLKYILHTLPSITWPEGGNKEHEKHFWKRLQLLMPKRRPPKIKVIRYVPNDGTLHFEYEH